ncbi:MAG: fibronectin type III domain-containing protein [Candidatus Acidiferrales bacterium]
MELRKEAPRPRWLPTPKSRISDFRFLFSIFAVALLAAGCAAPGEPVERKPRVPTPVADLAAAQQDDNVILTFTLPKESVDRRQLKEPPAIEIYRDFAPIASAAASATPGAPANPTLLVTIPSAMVDQYDDRGQIRYVDALKPEDFTQHPAAQALYIVRTRASEKKDSANSNLAALRIEPAADPITDLQAQITHQGVVLTWTPPQKTLIGSAPPIASYRIYRSEPQSQSTTTAPLSAPKQTTKANSPPVRIGDVPAPPFRDLQTKFGNTYTYSVRSIAQYPDAQVAVESADSNQITVTPRDTFPPAAPQGLEVVFVPAQNSAPAYFDLSWSINADNDIAGYNIYRTEQEGAPGNKVNDQLLLSPAFRDMNVVPGHRYFYTVTAVDRAGNESPASAPASGEMPALAPD